MKEFFRLNMFKVMTMVIYFIILLMLSFVFMDAAGVYFKVFEWILSPLSKLIELIIYTTNINFFQTYPILSMIINTSSILLWGYIFACLIFLIKTKER
jgi:hypothetical protein